MTDRLKTWMDEAHKHPQDFGGVAVDALRAVVDYCDRELRDQYPSAWASDIKAIIEGEVLDTCSCNANHECEAHRA